MAVVTAAWIRYFNAQKGVRAVALSCKKPGDVAKVHDAFADQTNIVRIDGRRAVYMAILKKADASTLAVVDAAKEAHIKMVNAFTKEAAKP